MSADALFERLARARRGRARHASTVYAPAVRARKGTYLDLFTTASRAGVQAARVDGAIAAIDPPPKLAKTKEHTIDLIVYYGKLAELDRADVRPRARVGRRRAPHRATGAPRRARPKARRADALDRARVPALRHRRAGARPAVVLVQHEAGPLRGVRGHRRRGWARPPSRSTRGRTSRATPAPGRA